MAKRLTILSNTSWFDVRECDGRPVDVRRVSTGGLWATLRDYAGAGSCDALVLNVASRELLVACALKKLKPASPLSACKLVAVDLILQRPRTRKQQLRHPLMRWLLQAVDLFILYYKDTAEVQRLYGIDDARMAYVPFKVNDLELIKHTETTDEGFFLSCGRSNRDYDTLCLAFDGLPYEAKILAPLGREAAGHGTFFAAGACPTNVQIISDDGSSASWIDWIARCQALILPIIPGMLSPSGIGTYLVAMALGKAVIMTEGPATTGMLEPSNAVLVPPSDAAALRAAVLRVAEDEAYRARIAAQGKAYALGLGDERRLAADIRQRVFDLLR